MTLFVNSLTVDAHDPAALARFWAAALDWPILFEAEDEVMIAPFNERHPGVHSPEGLLVGITFTPWMHEGHEPAE
ncbi:MAG: VOC family protein [Chloroflexota bacterium]